MDPLSITASVFTLLGACSGISKTLEAVRRIRDVPDALYALSNEIEDLRLTLLDIHERREEFFKRDPTEFNSKDWRLFDRCHSLLEGTWTKVHEAQMLISSNLPAPGRNSISRSDGLMIPRESGRLNKLKIQIREAKQNIQSLCSQLDRRYSAQIQTQLSIISETGSGIQTRLLENNTLHVHNHQRIEGKVDKLLDNPVRHDDYQRLERKIDRLLEMQEALSSPVKQSLRINTHGRVRIDVMLTRVPYLRGALKITCQCRNRNQSSNYVPSFLGDLADLFLGYAAAPVFGKHRPGCQYKFQAEMVFVYSFPAWFLNHALVLRAKYDSRLRCSISVRPILPYYHVAWKLIESNDIEGLKCLFSSSQMPLEAQDENGNRFLDAALMLGKFDMATFLLEIGANSKAESNGGRTPYHYAWDRILYEPLNEERNSRLKRLFPDPDFDELYDFSALHKAILGLSAESIDHAIRNSSSTINDGDRFGRSPLFWAVWRGDQNAAELLLAKQAHVNELNHIGSSPLTAAAISGKEESIKLLLQGGADPTLKNQLGATAIHYVVQNGEQKSSHQILESLIDAGTDVNEQCVFGTSLCLAAEHGSLEQINFLINHGADPSICENSGHNPLSIAILSGQRLISKALLDHNADHVGSIIDFGTFIHLVAGQADIESLRMLLDYRLKPRNINVKNQKGLTPRQVALKREDIDVEWSDLFMRFLENLDKDMPPQNQGIEGNETSSSRPAVDWESSDDEFVDAVDRIEG